MDSAYRALRPTPRLIFAAAAFGFTLAPSALFAQPRTTGFSAQLTYGHATSVNAFGADVGLMLPVGGFAIGADVGAVAASITNADTKFKLLNPFVGAYYLVDLPALKFTIGGGVALPLASADNLLDAATLGTVLGANGGWNTWMYLPDTVSFIAPARVDVSLVGLVGAAAEAGIGVMVPTKSAGRQTDFAYQLAGEAYLGLGIEPGLRVQYVHVPTAKSGVNDVAISVEPFVRLGAGPVHLQAGITYNVTKPYGPSTDTGGIWGAHLGLTVTL